MKNRKKKFKLLLRWIAILVLCQHLSCYERDMPIRNEPCSLGLFGIWQVSLDISWQLKLVALNNRKYTLTENILQNRKGIFALKC